MIRKAPQSIDWMNSNYDRLVSNALSERGADRYGQYLVLTYNYFILHNSIWLVDDLLSLFDELEGKFDLRRAATSVAWGMWASWLIHFVVFLVILRRLARDDQELMLCYVAGLILIALSIGYWERLLGVSNSEIFESTSRGAQSLFSSLTLFVIASSRKRVTGLLPIPFIMTLSNIGSGAALSLIFLLATTFLLATERKYYPCYSFKYHSLILAFAMACFLPLINGLVVHNAYTTTYSMFGMTIRGTLDHSLVNWNNISFLVIGCSSTAVLCYTYRAYLKKSYHLEKSIVLGRMVIVSILLALVLFEMKLLRLGATFDIDMVVGRLTPKVRLFVVGTIALVSYQFYKTKLAYSTRKILRIALSALVLTYFVFQLGRLISYQPWVSKEHQQAARRDIYELKLLKPLLQIKELRFLRAERDIFLEPFGIDVSNEIRKDIGDLKWDDEPFTNKYEPLILLKISKMLLDGDYKEL